jgi:hypothetical protein
MNCSQAMLSAIGEASVAQNMILEALVEIDDIRLTDAQKIKARVYRAKGWEVYIESKNDRHMAVLVEWENNGFKVIDELGTDIA